jgi:hypothetical protein
MLRTHFLQQWFNLSDSAMEDSFFGTPLCREFVVLADNSLCCQRERTMCPVLPRPGRYGQGRQGAV